MELEEMKNIPVTFEEEKTVSFGEHASDLIGKDYKNWERRDVVFLSASTGLGKTYWVMNDLYDIVNIPLHFFFTKLLRCLPQ